MTTMSEPAAASAPAGTRWVLEFNAPVAPLSSNDRRKKIAQAGDIRAWRTAVWAAARAAKLPVGGVERIRLDILLRFADRPDRRIPDRESSNYEAATGKALLDGLTPSKPVRKRPFPGAPVATVGHTIGYGLIPDDKDRNVDGPHLVIGEPLEWWPAAPTATVRVTVTVLEPWPPVVRSARRRAAVR
ncbi:hypothetical protein AB0B88_16115 [Micromonospora haikouensis]|uniref:hypothetical protein n=1 Tax=Micromonospora haikouensis TaxID=686309 RepID=UPI0033C3ADFA